MNRVNPWVSAGLVAGGVVLQTSFLDKLTFQGVKPDLVLLIAISSGLLRGTGAGGAYGVAAGFLQDLLIGRYVGLHALTYGLTGVVAGLFERSVFKDNPIVPLIGCLFGSILQGCVTYALLVAFDRAGPFAPAWRGVILPASIYNALLGPAVYWALARWLSQPPEPSGRNSRRGRAGIG